MTGKTTDVAPPAREPSALNRRDLLRTSLAVGAGMAVPLLGSAPAFAQAKRHDAQAAGGKLVIGALQDRALDPIKQKVIPLFEKQTGISVDYRGSSYSAFFAKTFQDGQIGEGGNDVLVMDDAWIPQFATAGILEDLGKHGIKGNAGFVKPFLDLGYWPPRAGARMKGYEDAKPALVALPAIGDLQTLTYREDVYKTAPRTWEELVTVGRAGVKARKIEHVYALRGVQGNPIVTGWYSIFLSYGGRFFDADWKVKFNSPQGKAAAEFYIRRLRALGPIGVAEYDSKQQRGAMIDGTTGAAIQSSGNALLSAQSREASKLGFAPVPRQLTSTAQIGTFVTGISSSAPNKKNAVTFMKWLASDAAQLALARAGGMPVRTKALHDTTASKRHALLTAASAQLQAGAQARPRTPDWSAIETILGTELHKALAAGRGGGEALDRAAKESTAYLKRRGYYR